MLILLLFKAKGGIDYFRAKYGFNQHITYREPKPEYEALSKLYLSMPRIPNSIVFVGNSLIKNCDWGELFENPKIRNRGIGGDCAEGVRKRMSEILSPPPSKLFFEIGLSDLARGYTISEIITHFQAIIDTTRIAAPDAKIYIHSVFPVREGVPARHRFTNNDILLLNKQLKQFSDKNECIYLDLHHLFVNDNGKINPSLVVDGVHLSNEGYHIWKKAISHYVND